MCESNGNLIVVDSGNDRLQVFSPEGKVLAQCGHSGSGDGQFNQPWGITLDKDSNIWVADWKNHRVQKWSPGGKYHDVDRHLWHVAGGAECFRRDLSRAVSFPACRKSNIRRPACSTIRPMSRLIRTAISTSPTGATIGSASMTKTGTPLTHLVGDAQVMSKWGQQSVDANPDMMKAYRRVHSLEPMWRFCFPTAVDYNTKTDEIIVADSQRNRLQVYKKVKDYTDFQANL